MRWRIPIGLLTVLVLAAAIAFSQPLPSAPILIPMSGQLETADGMARTGSVRLRLGLYTRQDDVEPVWTEEHVVVLDDAGRYQLVLGSTRLDGIPSAVFSAGGALWVGVSVEAEPEEPRMPLFAVPYASKAAVADTLEGRSASEFVLNSDLRDEVKAAIAKRSDPPADPDDDNPFASVMSVTGAIPKFTNGSGALGDSVMNEASSKIGVGGTGATSPGVTFEVWTGAVGTNRNAVAIGDFVDGVSLSGWVGLGWRTGTSRVALGGYRPSQWDSIGLYTAGAERVRIDSTGKVGIGTLTPATALDVSSGGIRVNSSGVVTSGFIDGVAVTTWDAVGYQYLTNKLVLGGYRSAQWDTLGFYTSASERVRIDSAGKVGIGTTSPQEKLHVAGNIHVEGNINAKYGQDLAEWVDADEDLEEGTLVVIDETAKNRVRAASHAYDTAVAGAVSAQPGVVLGEAGPGRELVAQSGRVRVKVDATYGAIKAGDLLVASSTPGHAMRSVPIALGGVLVHRPGTLVGKALEGLSEGRGQILVLLTLQ